MINVEDYSKDIKAVEEEINLLNMITEAKIDRFSKVDYLLLYDYFYLQVFQPNPFCN